MVYESGEGKSAFWDGYEADEVAISRSMPHIVKLEVLEGSLGSTEDTLYWSQTYWVLDGGERQLSR